MRVGMKQAMEELKDEGREPERQFDVEFGYDDEDPIERHVKLHLTPRKMQDLQDLQEAGHMPMTMEVRVDEDEDMSDEEDAEILSLETAMDNDDDDVDVLARSRGHFQPGLIQFRRSTRSSVPFSRSDSGGSARSDSSFEAIKADDYISMYGGRDDRASIISSASSTSSSSTTRAAALGSRPSLLRPRPRGHPYPEGGRQREHAGEAARGTHEEIEEDWLAGRTISETMVAKAGLRCQRGRSGRS